MDVCGANHLDPAMRHHSRATHAVAHVRHRIRGRGLGGRRPRRPPQLRPDALRPLLEAGPAKGLHGYPDDLLYGFIDATAAEGFPLVADFNGPAPTGVGGFAVNVIDGVRQNTGLVYLTEEVRDRPNLKISGGVLVDRVLFVGRRTFGVVTADGVEIPAPRLLRARTRGLDARPRHGPAR